MPLRSATKNRAGDTNGVGSSCIAPPRGFSFSVKQNIDKQGRMARGGFGLLFLLVAGCLVPVHGTLALIFLLVGLFSLFESWQGWCAVRACGIKTRF